MKGKFGCNLLFALLLVIGLIPTGCAVIELGINKTETDATFSVSTSLPDKVLSNSTNKVTWYMPANRKKADIPSVLNEVNKILQDKIDITLYLQVFSTEEEYMQEVNTALAANEPVDIVFSSKGLVDYHINSITGNFKKLNPYLRKYPTLNNILDKDFLDYYAVDGEIYGIPAMKTKAHNRGFLLRKDLVHKYDMDLDKITTLESIEPFLEIIRKNELRVIPLAVTGLDASFGLLDWDVICEGNIPGALYPNNRSTVIVNQFLEPESIEYYKLMRRWSINGYMHKDAASMQNIMEILKSQKYFAVIQPLTPGRDNEISEMTGNGWVQVDITEPIMTNNDLLDAILAIPSSSKNPEKAFRFIEMLYTDSNLKNLLDHGIENVHYNMVKENVISLIDPQNSDYNPGFSGKFGNMFLSFISDKDDPIKYEKILKYNIDSTVLDSLGFVFDRSDMRPQIAACESVARAYLNMLLTGSCDVDPTIEQFGRELRAAGIDDLLSEMQDQYNAWVHPR